MLSLRGPVDLLSNMSSIETCMKCVIEEGKEINN